LGSFDLITNVVYNKYLAFLYTLRYSVFRKADNMKFNVHKWNGKDWEYVATATAENEQIAAQMVSQRFGLKGRFASYPHADSYVGQKTSNSVFTVIE